MQTTIAPSQPESCAEWRENRQNKLRRGVTAQPEPFPHGLLDLRFQSLSQEIATRHEMNGETT
jgi:hypothetical protein